MSKKEGFSTNFALEMLRVALRDAGIPGILVNCDVDTMEDDDPKNNRHLSIEGEVQTELQMIDVKGECWIQRGESHTNDNPWKYGQIVFQHIWYGEPQKHKKMFYRHDEKVGMEQLRVHDIDVVNYIHTGEYAAWFAGQPETTTHGARSREEALGKLLLRFPERLATVVDDRKAG